MLPFSKPDPKGRRASVVGSQDMSSTESERMCPACGSTPVRGGMEGKVKRLPPTLTMVSPYDSTCADQQVHWRQKRDGRTGNDVFFGCHIAFCKRDVQDRGTW